MREQEPKNDEQTESVTDLEITSEQAEEVQGGTTSSPGAATIKVKATDRIG